MDNLFQTLIGLSDLNEASIFEARKTFLSYKESRTIKNSHWSDSVWMCTDEYSNINLNFEFKNKKYFEMSKKDFVDYVKTYTCNLFGRLSLSTIQRIIYDIKKYVSTNECFETQYENHIEEFISVLPIDDSLKEEAIDRLDFIEDEKVKNNQRVLASFDSYFLFNDILDRFWKECDDEKTKLFYFPIYLWWKITVVIPQRPKEFILIPRNCLEEIDGKYYITLRRDKLKGNDKTISYKISDDFIENKYQITDRIAKEVLWYIDKTKYYVKTELDTLFILDTHYRNWGRRPGINNRYLTRVNFTTILRYFYKEIIEEKYGYEVIYDREKKYLNSNQIQYINLGDSRHLALINIIAEGGTPLIAMELAGHDNPSMSSHYFSNITRLIECKTYRMAKVRSHYLISSPNEVIKTKNFTVVENGRCYSEKLSKNDYSDCVNVISENGEIGWCKECPYFRSENVSSDFFKDRLQKEYKQLSIVINTVRQGRGEIEDIIQVLDRIQSSAYTYKQYLLEELNGKK